MRRMAVGVCLFATLGLWAGEKYTPGKASDATVSLDARVLVDRAEMKAVLGQDPGDNIVIVEITVTPAAGKKVTIDRDEFLLRSDRDGQKGNPLHPSQIAGDTVMVVSSRGGTQGTGMAERRQVPFGIPGIPGGGGGVPMGMPGTGTPVAGAATADTSSADASVEQKDRGKNPLLASLKEKVLPEGEWSEPKSGLLYFVMEGKQRPKDLELVYRKSAPRLSVRFVKK